MRPLHSQGQRTPGRLQEQGLGSAGEDLCCPKRSHLWPGESLERPKELTQALVTAMGTRMESIGERWGCELGAMGSAGQGRYSPRVRARCSSAPH